MATVDDIKTRLDILDVASQYVQLQRSGRSYKATCPFHSEKTPSFFVFPERQTWRCFGACATGGDIFSFIMRVDNVDFGEALKRLARQAGVELPTRRDRHHQASLLDINEEAARFFASLLTSNEGVAARDYLQNRGILPETINIFELGLSPRDGHKLRDHLASKGHAPEQQALVGLVTHTTEGGYRDLFRGRLIFPIRGEEGSLLGFGARALGDATPKYLNSPKTPLFDKGRILYGMNLARDAIRQEGAIVVEGYMDTIMAHQHGFNTVVASMGTALTPDQASTLRGLASEVALALDPDAAGQEATLRSMESAWGIFHRPVATASVHGSTFYQRPKLPQLKVVPLPAGRDPDDMIRQSPEEWVRLVEEAVPLIDYLFHALASRVDPASAEGKAQLSQLLFPLIAATADSFQQDYYFQRLASLLGVSTESLEASLGRPAVSSRRPSSDRRRSSVQREASASPFARMEHDPLEEHCLAMLLQNPELAPAASALRLEHFQRPENREVLGCLMAGPNPDRLDEELKPHWDRLSSTSLPPADSTQKELALQDCVHRLEGRYLRQLKAEEEIKLAEATPEELDHYQQEVLDINLRMKHLFTEKVS